MMVPPGARVVDRSTDGGRTWRPVVVRRGSVVDEHTHRDGTYEGPSGWLYRSPLPDDDDFEFWSEIEAWSS